MKKEMIGLLFGTLEVVAQVDFIKPAKWICICRNCKSESLRYGHHLRKFGKAFCRNCQHVSTKHGLEGTRAYAAWQSMKQRCMNEKHKAYRNYGGRGIKVCERWVDSASNFIADMGHPLNFESLDRINNDGNYSPENCRWASKDTQMQNRRNSIPPVLVSGRLVTVKVAAILLDCCVQTVRKKYHKGMREFEIQA